MSKSAADGEVFTASETTDRATGRIRQKIAMWQTATSEWAFFEWTFTKRGRLIEVQLWPEAASIAAMTLKARPEDPFTRQELPLGTRHMLFEDERELPAGFNIALIVRTKPGQRICGQLTMQWALDS